MNALLSAEQAAMLMECGSQKVRERMKQNDWDLGAVIPPRNGGCKNAYEVNPKKLAELTGASVGEVFEALREKRPIRGLGGRFS